MWYFHTQRILPLLGAIPKKQNNNNNNQTLNKKQQANWKMYFILAISVKTLQFIHRQLGKIVYVLKYKYSTSDVANFSPDKYILMWHVYIAHRH